MSELNNRTTDSFRRCTREFPCPICGKDSWCQVINGSLVQCMRQATGSYQTSSQADGAVCYLHRLGAGQTAQPLVERPPPAERAAPEVLHRVYTMLLARLGPLPAQAAPRLALRQRGLTDAEIDRREYRAYPAGHKPWELASAVASAAEGDASSGTCSTGAGSGSFTRRGFLAERMTLP